MFIDEQEEEREEERRRQIHLPYERRTMILNSSIA